MTDRVLIENQYVRDPLLLQGIFIYKAFRF